jgi:hypothetical protein
MTDPYRLTTPAAAERGAPGLTRAGLIRPLAWTVLVVSAAGNSVASAAHLPIGIPIGLGLVTLASIAVLVVHRVRSAR